MILRAETSREHFERFAKTYDRQAYSDEAQYRAAQVVYESIVPRLISNPTAVILDVGCGTGILGEIIRGDFPDVTLIGIDFSDNMLDVSLDKKIYDLIGNHDLNTQELPVPDDVFDIIVSSAVFDYIKEIDLPLTELSRALKEGGEISITTYDSYPRLGQVMRIIQGGVYALATLTRAPETKSIYHRPSAIVQAFEVAGVEAEHRQTFDAYVDLGMPIKYHLFSGCKTTEAMPSKSLYDPSFVQA